MKRLTVSKTYKLYVGGAFVRSESGRTYPVRDQRGVLMANAAQASRKDARDAVVAARKGLGTWSKATPYLRGQVLYRVAEMLEARTAELVDLLVRSTGASAAEARTEVALSVDRVLHFAGWTDKLTTVFGGVNAVSSPHFSYSTVEPCGVVAVVAPDRSPLLGLVSVLLPALAAGNSVVLLAADDDPCVAVTFAEVLATSDVPAGLVNVLTGHRAEVLPWLASHGDVNGLDLTGVRGEDRTAAERAASGTVKRVLAPRREPDFTVPPGTARLRAFLEVKTVWHPVGAASLAAAGGY